MTLRPSLRPSRPPTPRPSPRLRTFEPSPLPPSRPDRLFQKRPMTPGPHQNRLPWEDDMTLCIAAASLENGEPRIVVAFDFRVETDWIGADATFKMSRFTNKWAVLFAGNVSSAREVINVYTTSLS